MKAHSTWSLLLVGLLLFGPRAQSVEVRADDIALTALHISDDGLDASFTGRWGSTDSGIVFADTDKNGFVVIRDSEMSAETWQALCKTLQEAFDQHAPVSFVSSGWSASRGGIMFFRAPPCQLRVVRVTPPKA